MAYDPGAIEAALAAAVGDDQGLIAELRLAFSESAAHVLETMEATDSPVEWHAAAARLRGLAASFGAVRLMSLAAEAADAVPGDNAVLARLRRAISRL